jgi:hypothetical protein
MESGIDVAITGDNAAITTPTNNAGQCCVSLKFIVEDAVDQATGQQCYYTTTAEGSRLYANSQTMNTCMPVGICLQSESKDMIKGAFGHFFGGARMWSRMVCWLLEMNQQ